MPGGKTSLVFRAQLARRTCAAALSWDVWPVYSPSVHVWLCVSLRGDKAREGRLRVEGVKHAGPTVLSQQHYVKVQGFIAADTE